jgi:hypothetical protein
MTANLRNYTLGKLRDDDTVGKVKQDSITSQLKIRSIEPVKDSPWTYLAFGVKEVHHLRDRVESTDRLVSRYNIRLIQDRRSESNPSGLLVAEFSEQQSLPFSGLSFHRPIRSRPLSLWFYRFAL